MKKYYRKKYVEPKHRQIAFNSFAKKCQICSYSKNIHVHHKDRNRKNNHISNLQVLCRRCHKLVHMNFYGMNEKQKNIFIEMLKNRVKNRNRRTPYSSITRNEVSKLTNYSFKKIEELKESGNLFYSKCPKEPMMYYLPCLIK